MILFVIYNIFAIYLALLDARYLPFGKFDITSHSVGCDMIFVFFRAKHIWRPKDISCILYISLA